MKIAGIVDALNLLTDLPFTEWAWSEAPADGYGVVTADGQSELKADSDPAAEKMLTGYVDVFIKVTAPDPTEDVEDAMRAIGVWFRMETIQFEPESGFIHIEWRYTDTMNNAKKAILKTLPLMLHVTSAEWDSDDELIVTFAETPGEIYEAIGTRPVGFYVTVEVEEGGATVTKTFWMTLADYTVNGSAKLARFAAFDDGNERYLEIFVNATGSAVATQGSWEVTAYKTQIVTDNNGTITDPEFTYTSLLQAFLNRTPVYIYYTGGSNNGNVLTLSYVGTYESGGETYYKACFVGAEDGIVWEYTATSPNDIMTEV